MQSCTLQLVYQGLFAYLLSQVPHPLQCVLRACLLFLGFPWFALRLLVTPHLSVSWQRKHIDRKIDNLRTSNGSYLPHSISDCQSGKEASMKPTIATKIATNPAMWHFSFIFSLAIGSKSLWQCLRWIFQPLTAILWLTPSSASNDSLKHFHIAPELWF